MPEESVPEDQILAAVCEDGTYTLNREAIELNLLTDKVRKKVLRKIAKGKKGVVFVDGHPEASYDRMVKLMDAIREAGNQAEVKVKIGLASLKPEDEFRACTPIEPTAPAPAPAPTEEG